MRVLFALLLVGSLVAADTSELFKTARVAMDLVSRSVKRVPAATFGSFTCRIPLLVVSLS